MSRLEVVPNQTLLIDLIRHLDGRIKVLENKTSSTPVNGVIETAAGTFNVFKDGKFVANYRTMAEAEKAE